MAEPGSNSKWGNPALMAAGFMTLLAASFHLQFLFGAGGFWRDEVNLINLASRSPLGEITRDSFPVLMPLLVRGCAAIWPGPGDSALRLLGVFIGLGILAAIWVSAWSTNRLPPLAGLALFGINSTVIAQGNSLRAYGLGTLFVMLAGATLWRYLKQPSTGRAILAGLLAVLSVQTLYQNSVLIGAICVGGWAVCWQRKDWRSARWVLAIGAVAAASILPYIPNLLAVRESASALRTGFSASGIFDNLARATGFPLPQYLYVWGILVLMVMVMGVVTLKRGSGDGEPAELQLYAAGTLVASLSLFGAFLWYAALPTQPWYFLPLMGLAIACIHAALPPVPRMLRAALLGFVLATACISIPYGRQDLSRRFTNVDLLAHRLTAEAGPKDFIVVAQWYCGLTFDRYFKGPASWATLPPLTDHRTHRYDLVQEQLRTPEPIRIVLDQASATLREGHRVWVVGRLYIPTRGSPAPTTLSPVPKDSPNVSASPYIRAWIAQLAHHLNQHSHEFQMVKGLPEMWINPNEDMQLFVANGWREEP